MTIILAKVYKIMLSKHTNCYKAERTKPGSFTTRADYDPIIFSRCKSRLDQKMISGRLCNRF